MNNLKTYEGFFSKSDDEQTATDVYNEMVRLYELGELPQLDKLGQNLARLPIEMNMFDMKIILKYSSNPDSTEHPNGLTVNGVKLDIKDSYLRKFEKFLKAIVQKRVQKSNQDKELNKRNKSAELRELINKNRS